MSTEAQAIDGNGRTYITSFKWHPSECADWLVRKTSKNATTIVQRLFKQKLTILMYHRVLEEVDPLRPGEPDTKIFEWQMRLIKRDFKPLRLDEAVRRFRDGNLQPGSLCVTFDDGYADNYDLAFPILNRLGVPATVFVATGYLDGGRMWNDTVIESIRRCKKSTIDLAPVGLNRMDIGTLEQKYSAIRRIIKLWKYLDNQERSWRVRKLEVISLARLPKNLMMTSEQVVKLHSKGVGIGGHTVNHPILSKLDRESACSEISGGKIYLEGLIDSPIDMFAYPNGHWGVDYTEEHEKLVRETGFIGAVSTDAGASRAGTNAYRLCRITPWERDPKKFPLRLLKNLISNTREKT